MRSELLIDATDLSGWANRREAQSLLPRLIRRLVLGSYLGIRRCDFPSGEGVQQRGWDGIVESEATYPFVPHGISGWEVSTSKDIGSKAEDDYRNRANDPLGLEPANTTYSAVSLRAWEGKREWAERHEGEGIWREVRAFDAHDLEAWLEATPAVHVWISTLLGKRPEHVIDLETYWDGWTSLTDPPTPPELVLAGREELGELIRSWLLGDGSELVVRAETRDEALAVVAASVFQLPSEARDLILSRTIVVQDVAAWRTLATSESGLILLPAFEVREGLAFGREAQHRTMIPLDRSTSVAGGVIEVPRLSSEAAAGVLREMGIDRDRARELGLMARRNFMAFRRAVARTRMNLPPAWSRPAEARPLIPIALAGSWEESIEGDRQALATLAGAAYETVVETAVRWSTEGDPPVRRVGGTWAIGAKDDAWHHLSRHLTRQDFDRLREAVTLVLGSPDPKYDLPPDQRWMAAVHGKGPVYSATLVEGLAETLAYLGANRQRITDETGMDVGGLTDGIVGQLLERANGDLRLWASLSLVLPLLAEASPDVFLAAVQQGLQGDPPLLVGLFGDTGDPIFSSSPHTGLLWALEVLAWNREFLGGVSVALAALSRLDPGGRLANRPFQSLRYIFLPWQPQTSANLDQRLRVLDTIRERESEIAWQLSLELLPEHHGVMMPSARPKLRQWQIEPAADQIPANYHNAIRETAHRLLQDGGADPSRLADLVRAYPRLPEEHREGLVQKLQELPKGDLADANRERLWSSIREVVSHHRSFPEAQWALPGRWLEELERVYRSFEPQDTLLRLGWLFSHDPRLIEGSHGDWRRNQETLDSARGSAVAEVFNQGGVPLIVDLARNVVRPDLVGTSLGSSNLLEDPNEFLVENLSSPDEALKRLSRGFIVGRILRLGPGGVHELLESLGPSLTGDQRAEILSCLPRNAETLGILEMQDAETQERFWHDFQVYGLEDDLINHAAGELVRYGRPYSAIDLMGFYSHDPAALDHDLAAQALEAAIETPMDQDRPLDSFGHHVADLLRLLATNGRIGEDRIARLEWAYLPVLGMREGSPIVLHRELARNPDFFVDVVSMVYRAEGEEPGELSEAEQARARHAYELLESWKSLATTQGGPLDGNAIMEWVTRARQLLHERGRTSIGDEAIGQVLSHSPRGNDDTWPHPAVRAVIDQVSSNDLDRGFMLGVFNSRGVTSRGPFEGGRQERELAEHYSSHARSVADEYPRTARLLRRIADRYERDARLEDQEAELREDLRS